MFLISHHNSLFIGYRCCHLHCYHLTWNLSTWESKIKTNSHKHRSKLSHHTNPRPDNLSALLKLFFFLIRLLLNHWMAINEADFCLKCCLWGKEVWNMQVSWQIVRILNQTEPWMKMAHQTGVSVMSVLIWAVKKRINAMGRDHVSPHSRCSGTLFWIGKFLI